MKKYIVGFAVVIIATVLFLINFADDPDLLATDTNYPSYYQEKAFHSRDGIGKFYLGREIAQVMGHQAMMWLERPSREKQEHPSAVLQALDLKATDIIADIGAGTGYFSFRMASFVPEGKVLAVDIQPEMLDVIESLKQQKQVKNVETVLGEVDDPHLPENTIDVTLMVDAYHEFSFPREMMEGIFNSLKVGGRVILVEYRREDPLIMIKPLHKMTQKQVKKEIKTVGLQWVDTQEFLPQQHFMIFAKPG